MINQWVARKNSFTAAWYTSLNSEEISFVAQAFQFAQTLENIGHREGIYQLMSPDGSETYQQKYGESYAERYQNLNNIQHFLAQ